MHCLGEQFPISKLWVNRNGINENPEYQRESAVWSKEKQQLFIDSILNKFDVPKIYLHDLRSLKGLHQYAVVDGKQRLHTIYEFLQSKFAIAADFKLFEPIQGQESPKPGSTFSQLSEFWQEEFKASALSIVLIQNASDDDIEELFSRLNNGEPLNAAEKRNAMSGEMAKLIRKVAKHVFFEENIRVKNNRYQHLEIAAKFLLLEATHQSPGGGIYADLKKRFLDDLVEKNKTMPVAAQTGLSKRVNDQLSILRKVFKKQDPLLSKQAALPLYYIFVKRLATEYGDAALYAKINAFLEQFHARRIANLEFPEEDRDATLIEFGRLMQQGTNDMGSLKDRVSILTRYFLLEHPDVAVKDPKRLFTDEERMAIWILGGKKCGKCSKEVELDEMHADHQIQWSHGGATTLKNGRCLCASCNTGSAKKTK